MPNSTELSSTLNQLGGDPDLVTKSSVGSETFKGRCSTIEEFRNLERQIGVAARWTKPKTSDSVPNWESRWKWDPKLGYEWPRYGSDCY